MKKVIILQKVKTNWKDNTEQAKKFWSKSLLERIATIRTWHFMWKFPFIKIVDFTGSIKDIQKAVNIQMGQIIDNKKRK